MESRGILEKTRGITPENRGITSKSRGISIPFKVKKLAKSEVTSIRISFKEKKAKKLFDGFRQQSFVPKIQKTIKRFRIKRDLMVIS
ncbi:hypothetical protein [Neobacillus mesonae]|uniref:hypothetical protein n=1 Tax=Neobacillus mesonae TaxID=1193713 RepID=UPI00203EC656|nr:hypothetical protein [Neobacillus mesonae]MCM3567999.1 hypothetical protein [Neobacillus mesonae]